MRQIVEVLKRWKSRLKYLDKIDNIKIVVRMGMVSPNINEGLKRWKSRFFQHHSQQHLSCQGCGESSALAKWKAGMDGIPYSLLLVAGLAPIGCAPYYLWLYHSKHGECVEMINDMILEINFVVRYMVEELNQELVVWLFPAQHKPEQKNNACLVDFLLSRLLRRH